MSDYIVRSFTGAECLGNLHHVIEVDHADLESLVERSLALAPAILVVLNTKEIHQTQKIKPLFFHNGREVKFCGSGLLAVMPYLDVRHDVGLASGRRLDVSVNHKSMRLCKYGGRYGFTANAALNETKVPCSPWSDILNTELECAVELPAGYVIAELSSVAAVRALSPNFDQLKKQKRVALIVTALGDCSIPEDYAMRYFAPQFGNPEDAATGSANLYLMKYWQQKLNKNELVGRQLSVEGGLFYGCVNGENVTLSGNTEYRQDTLKDGNR